MLFGVVLSLYVPTSCRICNTQLHHIVLFTCVSGKLVWKKWEWGHTKFLVKVESTWGPIS